MTASSFSVFFESFQNSTLWKIVLMADCSSIGSISVRNQRYAQREKIKEMTCADSFSVSERFARSLLAAWESSDSLRLKTELNQIALADCSGLSGFEHEQFEIVEEAAKTMRIWLNGARKQPADLNMALTLLRHLATLEGVAC
jgi:hypothetical protein